MLLLLIFLTWLQLCSTKITYKVIAQRLSDQPIISSKTGSDWDYNYNAAIFNKNGELGLLVTVRNKQPNLPNEVTQSYLAVSHLTFNNGHVSATPTTNDTMTHVSPFEDCGTENPQITINNGIYYLFFTSNDCSNASLSSAISPNPFDSTLWMRIPKDLPTEASSKSGAALFASDENGLKQDYLFWSDSSASQGIGIATGVRGKWNWVETGDYLIQTRDDSFDSVSVESGATPLKLNTGDYLYLYNSAQEGYPSEKPDYDLQYNLGYAILDGTDPTQVLQRSDEPIMSPELDWEIGNSTDYLTPNVVFLEGLIPDPNGCKYANLSTILDDDFIENAECFFGVYGGADSHLGAVQIVVSSDANITTPPPPTPMVSPYTYKIVAQRVSDQPILSKDMGSAWDYNYNAALFNKDGQIGVVVRVQNLQDPNVPYNVGPSHLAVSTLTFKNGQVTASPTTNQTWKLKVPSEACGTEDPRITYVNDAYYLFYTAYDCTKASLSSAVSGNPFEPNSWIRLSEDLPLRNWSKSGAALFASDDNGLTKDYLFWGDSSSPVGGIGVATGVPGKWGWSDSDAYLLKTRSDYFDSNLVESGSTPLKLNTGDYLFIYNSARGGYHSSKPGWNLQYNLGYAILAGTDPTQVLQRSGRPIMSPDLDWEIGDSAKHLTPNVVFLEGLIPDPDGCKYVDVTALLGEDYLDNAECFFGVYGGADSALGAVRIVVSSDANITHPVTSSTAPPKSVPTASVSPVTGTGRTISLPSVSPITGTGPTISLPSVSPITGTGPTISVSTMSTSTPPTTTTIPEKKYKVVANRLSNKPIISKSINSFWDFNYNAALFTEDEIPGVLIRVQNLKNESVPYEVGPSHFTVSMLSLSGGDVSAEPPQNDTFILMPPAEACGTEDPRIAYNNGIYYLFYTANDCNTSMLSSAISANPFEPNSWVRYANSDLPGRNWSKSGAVLFANSDNLSLPNYLFWGDSSSPEGGIGIAIGTPGTLGWVDTDEYLLKTRYDSFDSLLVESGPSPLKLSTGDYLFIYNSAQDGYPSVKPDWDLQYNLGYAILSGDAPTNVFERSDVPLMRPELDWEVGNTTDYLTPNVVFLEGLIPDPNHCQYADVSGLLGDQYVANAECFFGVYGAADSNLGAVQIIVSTKSPVTSTTTPPPTTTSTSTPSSTTSTTTTVPSTAKTTTTPTQPPPVEAETTPNVEGSSTTSSSTTTKIVPPTTTTTNDAKIGALSFVVLFIATILRL